MISIAALLIAFLPPFEGKVVSVHDGDTVTVKKTLPENQVEIVKVRLFGIDAPELKQPHGQASKQALSGKVFGKTVEIEPTSKDRYGRTIASVKQNGLDISLQLVAEGHAWWYEKYARRDTGLSEAQTRAKAEKLGLWADPEPVAPWDFRNKKAEVK